MFVHDKDDGSSRRILYTYIIVHWSNERRHRRVVHAEHSSLSKRFYPTKPRLLQLINLNFHMNFPAPFSGFCDSHLRAHFAFWVLSIFRHFFCDDISFACARERQSFNNHRFTREAANRRCGNVFCVAGASCLFRSLHPNANPRRQTKNGVSLFCCFSRSDVLFIFFLLHHCFYCCFPSPFLRRHSWYVMLLWNLHVYIRIFRIKVSSCWRARFHYIEFSLFRSRLLWLALSAD